MKFGFVSSFRWGDISFLVLVCQSAKASFFFIFISFLFSFQPASAKENNLVVFFLPHQDDEMILAGGIANYVQQGKDVKVVMATDGAVSDVRQKLNKDGYNYLTRTVFVSRRNDEFFRVMLKLGVKPENIYFANPGGKSGGKRPKYKDGQLLKEQAKEIMESAFQRWGEGIYLTVAGSPENSLYSHPDHQALEQALREFESIKQKYFYTDEIDSGEARGLSVVISEKKKKALAEYFVWEPNKRRFAIGAHSVADRLRFWQGHWFEYVVK